MKKRKRIKKLIKRKKSTQLFLVSLLALGLILGVGGIYLAFKERGIKEETLNLEEFQEVEVKAGLGVVFLVGKEDSCNVLPIYVSWEQSQAIRGGLNNQTEERPNTHDLVKNILEKLGVELVGVKIISLEEGTYYASLVLKKGEKIFEIDSRPSDGIALGLRMGSLIYVKEEIMFKYGVDICGGKYPEEKWMKEIDILL